jgi:hypothetical protein
MLHAHDISEQKGKERNIPRRRQKNRNNCARIRCCPIKRCLLWLAGLGVSHFLINFPEKKNKATEGKLYRLRELHSKIQRQVHFYVSLFCNRNAKTSIGCSSSYDLLCNQTPTMILCVIQFPALNPISWKARTHCLTRHL